MVRVLRRRVEKTAKTEKYVTKFITSVGKEELDCGQIVRQKKHINLLFTSINHESSFHSIAIYMRNFFFDPSISSFFHLISSLASMRGELRAIDDEMKHKSCR